MRKNPKTRALEVCLLRLQAGDSLNQVLSAYPRWISTLQPILEAALVAQGHAEAIHISTSAQETSRGAFLSRAQEMIPSKVRPSWAKTIRRITALIFLLLLAALASWQIAVFSTPALPGDILYPIKRFSEQVRLSLQGNAGLRLSMEQSHDQERLREIAALIKANRSGDIEFSGGLADIGANEWLVSGVTVLIPTDTRMVGEINPGVHVKIQGKLQPDGVVIAHQIQPLEYIFQGQVQSINTDMWVIEGLSILVDPQTSMLGNPDIGNKVRATLQLTLEENLAARLIEVVSR